MKRLVIIESPYRGDGQAVTIERNVRYARACMRDAFLAGESPFASHLLYTQPGVLRDEIADERAIGMEAGWEWLRAMAVSKLPGLTAAYVDLGVSGGMQAGIERAQAYGVVIEERRLGAGWAPAGAGSPRPSEGARAAASAPAIRKGDHVEHLNAPGRIMGTVKRVVAYVEVRAESGRVVEVPYMTDNLRVLPAEDQEQGGQGGVSC